MSHAKPTEYDYFVDGVVDSRYVEKSAYDRRNNIVEYVYEDDDNADGVLEGAGIYAYKWNARQDLLESAGAIDYGADGVIDARVVTTFTYERRDLTRIDTEWDNDGDGLFEQFWTAAFSYEKRGHLLHITQTSEDDWDGDGAVDSRYVFTTVLDNQENVVGWSSEDDYEADGIVDSQRRYRAEFDAHRNLLLEVEEFSDDGVTWRTATTRYEYLTGWRHRNRTSHESQEARLDAVRSPIMPRR